MWFVSRRVGLDILHAMHAAEQTAAGWVALASRKGETCSGAPGVSFADRHANAVGALREALLGHLPAVMDAALEGWLLELTT